MKDFPIPVVGFGPGSQAEDEALEYIAAPGDMATFRNPRLPEGEAGAVRDAAVAVLQELLERMKQGRFGEVLSVDLGELDAATRTLVNEALGEGEVSATVAGDPPLWIQETVFAGVWRVLSEAAGERPRIDRIDAGPMPAAVVAAGEAASVAHLDAPAPPAGVMNAPAVLSELDEAVRTRRPGDAAHIINLTLLPMTPEDLAYLGTCLGVGPVVILSRGYGNCRITRTRLRDTWWVQYFNSGDRLILNTLEVTTLPDVAPAAEEDYADSIARLDEWIGALRKG